MITASEVVTCIRQATLKASVFYSTVTAFPGQERLIFAVFTPDLDEVLIGTEWYWRNMTPQTLTSRIYYFCRYHARGEVHYYDRSMSILVRRANNLRSRSTLHPFAK